MSVIYFNVKEWETPEKLVAKRWQSACQACQREDVRIRAGQRRRGYRYNRARPGMTPEQRNKKARARHRRRMTARRKDNPYVPLKPFAEFVAELVGRDGYRQVAFDMRIDESYLKKIITQVNIEKSGRIEPWVDVRLVLVDDWLSLLGMHLWEIYDHEKYPYAFDGALPRKPNRPKRKKQPQPEHLKPFSFKPHTSA